LAVLSNGRYLAPRGQTEVSTRVSRASRGVSLSPPTLSLLPWCLSDVQHHDRRLVQFDEGGVANLA